MTNLERKICSAFQRVPDPVFFVSGMAFLVGLILGVANFLSTVLGEPPPPGWWQLGFWLMGPFSVVAIPLALDAWRWQPALEREDRELAAAIRRNVTLDLLTWGASDTNFSGAIEEVRKRWRLEHELNLAVGSRRLLNHEVVIAGRTYTCTQCPARDYVRKNGSGNRYRRAA